MPSNEYNERRTRDGRWPPLSPIWIHFREVDTSPAETVGCHRPSPKWHQPVRLAEGKCCCFLLCLPSSGMTRELTSNLHGWPSLGNVRPCPLSHVLLQGKTGFGMPRNTQTAVEFADNGKKWNIEQLRTSDATVRLQSGTNQYESQKVCLRKTCLPSLTAGRLLSLQKHLLH